MQLLGTALLALLLAHLCGDFLLQTDAIIRAKKNGATGFVVHGIIHYLLAVAVLMAFTRISVWTLYSQCLLAAYAVLHIAVDYGKQSYLRLRRLSDSTGPFIVDQALHVVMVAALSMAIVHIRPNELQVGAFWADRIRRTVLLLAVTYVAVVFAGGYLVRSLTRSLTENMTAPDGEDRDALRNAGLYIGWLERFLVLTALLMQSPAMIGLILTGKSIARLGELKGPKFAEYFLIGTFLSISMALVGGIVLMLTLYGTVFPK